MRFLNLPRVVCSFLLGKDHNVSHRMIAGVGVMAVGVSVAKMGGDIHVFMIHYIADGIGYFIHGLGCVPFVEALLSDEDSKG